MQKKLKQRLQLNGLQTLRLIITSIIIIKIIIIIQSFKGNKVYLQDQAFLSLNIIFLNMF